MLTRGQSASYVGRFAPSPTGPLHFGSLVAAVASYLESRFRNGRWLLRIEDIDPPREQPGSADAIIRTLDRYGFEWDGEVRYQSQSHEAHEAALQSLLSRGLAYRCGCSRRDLENCPRGVLGTIYPGTCRSGCDAPEAALRVRTNDDPISFADRLQGVQAQRLESESGDFVVRRRDDLVAYQLAVVVNDEIEGVTEVVRGIDLMDSTPRQIWLQQLLSYRTPGYVHIPVITHPDGDKLSKLTGAPGIPATGRTRILIAALLALHQPVAPELESATLAEVWRWALQHWNLEVLRGQTAVPTDSAALSRVECGLW